MAHMKLSVAKEEARRIVDVTESGHTTDVRLVVQRGRHFICRGTKTLCWGHSWDEALTRLLTTRVMIATSGLAVPDGEEFAKVCEHYFARTLGEAYPPKVVQPKDVLLICPRNGTT